MVSLCQRTQLRGIGKDLGTMSSECVKGSLSFLASHHVKVAADFSINPAVIHFSSFLGMQDAHPIVIVQPSAWTEENDCPGKVYSCTYVYGVLLH